MICTLRDPMSLRHPVPDFRMPIHTLLDTIIMVPYHIAALPHTIRLHTHYKHLQTHYKHPIHITNTLQTPLTTYLICQPHRGIPPPPPPPLRPMRRVLLSVCMCVCVSTAILQDSDVAQWGDLDGFARDRSRRWQWLAACVCVCVCM